MIAASVANRYLDRVEVPPDGLEHNFGRQRVYWLKDSIFKASHLTVDQSRRRGVKPRNHSSSPIS
jgi:hypothetical protein